jgi:hypothetical protein
MWILENSKAFDGEFGLSSVDAANHPQAESYGCAQGKPIYLVEQPQNVREMPLSRRTDAH